MTSERAKSAIEASDTDELVRVVDGLVASQQWEAMVDLRSLCDEAVTRGKQLWGVSEFIRYRLALDSPPVWAGPAVTEGRTRFTLGPLSEVVASRHSWDELEPHLAPGPERTMVAHERIIRGEDLRGESINPLVMELPCYGCDWEPSYPLATYFSDRVEALSPPPPEMGGGEAVDLSPIVEDPDGTTALVSLVEHWVEASNGRVQATCVEGKAAGAIAALGVAKARLGTIAADQALAWMAWAAATGGAMGRRRGAAQGRFSAWWTAHELAGLAWPPDPDELGEAVTALRWHWWSDGSPDTGWALRLAVESVAEGLAWAIAAVDAE